MLPLESNMKAISAPSLHGLDPKKKDEQTTLMADI